MMRCTAAYSVSRLSHGRARRKRIDHASFTRTLSIARASHRRGRRGRLGRAFWRPNLDDAPDVDTAVDSRWYSWSSALPHFVGRHATGAAGSNLGKSGATNFARLWQSCVAPNCDMTSPAEMIPSREPCATYDNVRLRKSAGAESLRRLLQSPLVGNTCDSEMRAG